MGTDFTDLHELWTRTVDTRFGDCRRVAGVYSIFFYGINASYIQTGWQDRRPVPQADVAVTDCLLSAATCRFSG